VKLVKDLQREESFRSSWPKMKGDGRIFPDVPTFLETLGAKKPTGLSWQAFVGWAGSPRSRQIPIAPPALILWLNRCATRFAKVMKDPEVDIGRRQVFGDGWKPIAQKKIEAVIHG
jgi:hypothetical protein